MNTLTTIIGQEVLDRITQRMILYTNGKPMKICFSYFDILAEGIKRRNPSIEAKDFYRSFFSHLPSETHNKIVIQEQFLSVCPDMIAKIFTPEEFQALEIQVVKDLLTSLFPDDEEDIFNDRITPEQLRELDRIYWGGGEKTFLEIAIELENA